MTAIDEEEGEEGAVELRRTMEKVERDSEKVREAVAVGLMVAEGSVASSVGRDEVGVIDEATVETREGMGSSELLLGRGSAVGLQAARATHA